jgi:glutamate N-acetyltransferase / amino-acid N-acetyltransferase
MKRFKSVKGGVTAARGFLAAGVEAGIKPGRPDLALLVAEKPAAVAGLFTSNRIQAAPVRLCRDRLRGGRATAVIVNAGCANACTGKQGAKDAELMGRLTAQALGVDPKTVFVCSTGTIGVKMPMDKIAAGIPKAVRALSGKGGPRAVRAIMTTDTVAKEAAVELRVGGRPVRVGGMAKGAGMIEPNMATMLAFVTTDARVAPTALQQCLREAVAESFNRITVDGDQSTNDTILLLASGAAGNAALSLRHRDWGRFCEAVKAVCYELAMKIVEDGEGATKFVTITVRGARTDAEAHLAARAIARSFLVKTSWYGGDPNWGRVIDAVGYSGADVREERVDIRYDAIRVVRNGQKAENVALRELEKVIANGASRSTWI